jgi:hypothetical protein
MTRMLLIVLLLGSAGCSAQPSRTLFPAGELVDLSHAYDAQTIFWPTAEAFRLEKVADGITDGG